MRSTETQTSERRLSLSRETLRTLTADELRLVAGGAMSNSGGVSCLRDARAC